MKIALCGRFNTEKKHQGGSAEVLLDLAKELSKRNKITLYGRGKPTDKIKKICYENNLDYYFIPADTTWDVIFSPLRALILLKKKLDEEEIINTHTGCFAFASVFFRKKRKIITNIHEIIEIKKRSFVVKVYGIMENFMLNFAAKRSDLIIVNSNYMKNLIKIKSDKVKIISNWIDTSIFKFKLSEEIRRYSNKNVYRLLYVGRLTDRKGIIELIKSLDLIKRIEVKLMIIGIGNLDQYILNIAKKNNKILYLGYVERDKLSKYYSNVDLTIVPSKYEPFGLVPLESLSCGTPVLVGNNTGLKEIITPEIGFFIKNITPEDIAKSIEESIFKNISKKKCRNYVLNNYNKEKIINTYEKEFKNILLTK